MLEIVIEMFAFIPFVAFCCRVSLWTKVIRMRPAQKSICYKETYPNDKEYWAWGTSTVSQHEWMKNIIVSLLNDYLSIQNRIISRPLRKHQEARQKYGGSTTSAGAHSHGWKIQSSPPWARSNNNDTSLQSRMAEKPSYLSKAGCRLSKPMM